MIVKNKSQPFLYGVFAIFISSCSFYFSNILILILLPLVALPLFTLQSKKPHFSLIPNWITLLKLILVLLLLVFFESISPLEVSLLSLLIILVDVLDGYFARRLSQTSKFGAIFDSEVDAFYVLTCAFGSYLYFDMPVWVLFMGYIRYLYEIPLFFLNKNKTLKKSQGRSIYAILAGVVFLVIAFSFSLGPFQYESLLVANLILLFSFSKSFYHDFIQK